MPHFQHVSAQRRLPFQSGAGCSAARARASARDAVHGFTRGQDQTSSQFSSHRSTEARGQRSRTSFAVGASSQTQNSGCQVECRGSRITENNSRRNWTNDGNIEIPRRTRPEISAEQGECGNVAFRLPARGNAPGKIHIVGDNQYSRMIHFKLPHVRSLLAAWCLHPGQLYFFRPGGRILMPDSTL